MARRFSLIAAGNRRCARHLTMLFYRSHSGRPFRARDSFTILKTAIDLVLNRLPQLVAADPTLVDSY